MEKLIQSLLANKHKEDEKYHLSKLYHKNHCGSMQPTVPAAFVGLCCESDFGPIND